LDLISRLDAIEGIKLAKAIYFRGVDSKDSDLLRSVFAEDVEIDFRGASTDPVTGFNIAPESTDEVLRGGETAARTMADSLKTFSVTVHHASIPEIEILSETTGKALWPMVDRLLFGPGFPFAELIGYGHYHDTYEKVGNRWVIKTMRLTRTRIDTIPAKDVSS